MHILTSEIQRKLFFSENREWKMKNNNQTEAVVVKKWKIIVKNIWQKYNGKIIIKLIPVQKTLFWLQIVAKNKGDTNDTIL